VDRVCAVRGLQASTSGTARLRLVDVDHDDATGDGISRETVERAVRAEGALTAADVLDRRTRIGLVADDRARSLAFVEEAVAEALATLS
jgi:glycerol-3-phosphate dehydrogenase